MRAKRIATLDEDYFRAAACLCLVGTSKNASLCMPGEVWRGTGVTASDRELGSPALGWIHSQQAKLH